MTNPPPQTPDIPPLPPDLPSSRETADRSSPSQERRFFAGPQNRWAELWWAIEVFIEFIRGFRKLHFVGPCVTVFGSARYQPEHQYYALAEQVGAALARVGFTVMTGGGPGLMEAANKGAKAVGGTTAGCNIRLPSEQEPNRYLDLWLEFEHFFARKVMLAKYSYAFVVLPGGFGTLDEAFEAATLVQTGKIKDFPVVFMGTAFWAPLEQFIKERMIAEGVIHREDAERLMFTDSVEEAVEYIRDTAVTRFGLSYEPPQLRRRRRWWLFE